LLQVFKKYNFSAVFHLASFSQVQESNKKPIKYIDNNIQSTKNILECMETYFIKYLVFSSSAAVYKSKTIKLSENYPLKALSVYGKTKLDCENMINNGDSYKTKDGTCNCDTRSDPNSVQ